MEYRMLGRTGLSVSVLSLGGLFVSKVGGDRVQAIAATRRALELGLVDQLGNFNDAVALAASLGKIEGRPQLVEPEAGREKLWRKLLQEESLSFLSAAWGRLRSGAGPQYLLSLPGD